MSPQPKIKFIRSEPYKKFIRGKRCLFCNSAEIPNHTWIVASHHNLGYGVTGDKVSDLQTLPACSRIDGQGCHDLEHWIGHNLFAGDGVKALQMIKYHNEFFALGNKL